LESFRADIEAVVRLAPEERKGNAGRPFDAVMMFKVLVLQTLYYLADEQVEYLIRGGYRLCAFWAVSWKIRYQMRPRVWLFREALAKAGLVKTLFDCFHRHLDAKGYIRARGQIVEVYATSR